MIFRRLFILPGIPICEGEQEVEPGSHESISLSLYCFRCGASMGRIASSTADFDMPWGAAGLLCHRHPIERRPELVLPGSYYLNLYPTIVAAFPDAVLQYEVLRHLAYKESQPCPTINTAHS